VTGRVLFEDLDAIDREVAAFGLLTQIDLPAGHVVADSR